VTDDSTANGNDAMADLINVGMIQSWFRKRIEATTNPIACSHLQAALSRLQRALMADSEGCLRAAVPVDDVPRERRHTRAPTRGPI